MLPTSLLTSPPECSERDRGRSEYTCAEQSVADHAVPPGNSGEKGTSYHERGRCDGARETLEIAAGLPSDNLESRRLDPAKVPVRGTSQSAAKVGRRLVQHPFDLARQLSSLSKKSRRGVAAQRHPFDLSAKDLDDRQSRIETVHEGFGDQERSRKKEQDTRITNAMLRANTQERLQQVGNRDLR